MNKDTKDVKDKPHYEFHSGDCSPKAVKNTAPSKLKCGRIGIDCLIKN